MDASVRNPALALVDQLVCLATDLGETDQDYVEARTLTLLDELIVAIYQVNPNVDFVEPEVDPVDTRALREVLSQRYPRWRTYNTVMTLTTDVGETELAIGHAIDDLTDILTELLLVRSLEQSGDTAQAMWMLLDSYYNFWRGPLRSLQMFLHYLETESEDEGSFDDDAE